MEVSITIDGLKTLDQSLRELGAEVGAKTLRSALKDAAKPILDDMKHNAPVGSVDHYFTDKKRGRRLFNSGYLKSKTKMRTRLNKRGVSNKRFGKNDAVVVQVGTFGVPYVVQIEFGVSNRGIPATPYIRNAIEKASESIHLFKQHLSRRIELTRKRLARKR